jgi:hypothetical protein
MKHSSLSLRLHKRWYKAYNSVPISPSQITSYLSLQSTLRSHIISHLKSTPSHLKPTDSDFPFKATPISLPTQPIADILKKLENSLSLPVEEKEMNEDELKGLLEEVDFEEIDLEELEEMIATEDINEDEENYSLGKEFDRKVSAKKVRRMEERKKREELRERLKEEKAKKRERKEKVKKEESEGEEEAKEQKKIEKKSLKDIMQRMNTTSRLDFTRMLLESRKRSEEERRSKSKSKGKRKKADSDEE